MFLLSCNVFAIRFSQPVKLGDIAYYPVGDVEIRNALSNNGVVWKKNKSDSFITYKSGVAIFGNGNNVIYVHYGRKDKNSKELANYGGKEISNTFYFMTGYGCDIMELKNDEGIEMYLLHGHGADIRGEKYTILAKMKDGKFVQYFDTDLLRKKYLGTSKDALNYIWLSGYSCNGDTFIIHLKKGFDKNEKSYGEFRFKWDDKAQWFGIEQVVY